MLLLVLQQNARDFLDALGLIGKHGAVAAAELEHPLQPLLVWWAVVLLRGAGVGLSGRVRAIALGLSDGEAAPK